MALSPQRQQSFATGMWPGMSADLIPQDGAESIRDYLLDAQGRPYRRGGVLEYAAALGTDDLTFVGDYHLAPGQRTVIANRASFGVVAADKTVVDIGGGGLLDPTRAHVIQGHLVFDGGLTYGGSVKAADYTTGSVTVAAGSDQVTGSGTTWNTLVDAGMIFRIDGAGREFIVKSIDATNRLTLTEPFVGTGGSGKFYRLSRVGLANRIATSYAVVGKRLFAFENDRAHFTPYDQPAVFNDDDYHQIPGGTEILGGDAQGDAAVVFTTDGIWMISNVSLEPVDDFGNIQQRLDHTNPAVLWHREGIARWNESLIFPALDGIYMLNGQRLDLPIQVLYRDYVRNGLKTGLAWTDHAHYFLPILEQNNDVVDLLVCRLDPAVYQGRHMPWINPWTRFRGPGAGVAGTVRTARGENPVSLVAGGRPELMEAHYFNPDAEVPDDLGTLIDDEIITRDYPTGNGNQNVTRRMQLDYELWDTENADNPTIAVNYATGARMDPVADWGEFDWGGGDWASPDGTEWTAMGTAPEDLRGLVQHRFDIDSPPRSRNIRFRLRSSGRVAKLMIRGLTIWTRQSTKAD